MRALRGRAPDIALVLILVVGAWSLGWCTARAYRESGSIAHQPGFDLAFFGVALMKACGRGEAGIVTGDRQILPALTSQDKIDRAPVGDFLDGRRERVDCDQIGKVASMPLDPMLQSSRYLIAMASAGWRLTQPKWTSIDTLLGALFAATIAAAYGIGRLGMGPIASAVVAVFFALSPLHLSGLSSLRDYSKVPFFAMTVLVCGVSARKRLTSIQALALALASGAVLGLGFGMRTDVGTYLPLIVATLLLFAPGSMARSWRIRLGGAVVCVAAFLVVAWPIIAVHAGGNTSHWAILGFSHEFDSALGVRPGPYRLNYFYNDSAVGTIVAAFAQRSLAAGAPGVVEPFNYDVSSREYLSALVTAFPADALVRMWAAVLKVADLPFANAVSRVSEYGLPMDRLPGPVAWALDLRRQWLGSLNGAGLPLLAAAVVGLAAYDVRLAAFVFLAFCYLAGSASIQFQPRHAFHLEVLPLWILTFVPVGAVSLTRAWIGDVRAIWSNGARRLPRMAAYVAVIAGVAVVPLGMARVYQRRNVEALLSGYQSAQRELVSLEPQPLERGWTRLGAPTLGAPADPPAGPMRAEMLVLQVSAHCNSESVDVRFAYEAPPVWDFSRTLSLRTPAGGEAPVEVFMPVYYAGGDRPAAAPFRFSGVDVPAASISCVQGLFRLREPSRHLLLLETVLPRNWRDLSLYQSLEAVESTPTYASDLSR